MGSQFLAAAISVDGVTAVRWLIAVLGAGWAAWTDSRTRRIPNILTFPMFLAGLGVALVIGGLSGLGDSVMGALVLGLPPFLLFVLGGGAGDVKIMAALGAWVGFHDGLVVLCAVAIAGGVMGISFALVKGYLREVIANLRMAVFGVGLAAIDGGKARQAREFMPPTKSRHWMPYGLAIFVGTLCAAGWVLLWK